MPNKFEIKTLVLNGQIVSVTGDSLYINGSYVGSGDFYSLTNPNNFIRSGDIQYPNLNGLTTSGQLESTGTSLQNQINGLDIPSVVGLIRTGDVNTISGSLQDHIEFSGGYLYGLINASSAGVSSINSTSGVITINGAGNVSVTTASQTITISGNTGFLSNYYPVSNPEHYLKSGEATNVDLSGYGTTGSFDSRYLETGSSGYFYPWSNPNNFLRSGDVVSANTSGLSTSGNVENTGTAIQNQLANYYLKNNPNQFATSGNLETSGTNLQNQITSIKNGTGVFIQNSNLNGLISTGSADLRYIQTGVSGDFLKNLNLNGLISTGAVLNISGSLQQNIERSGGYLYGLINASSAGVSSINSQSGALTINGAGNVSISTSSQTITVSGNTGEYINFYKTSNPNQFIRSGDINYPNLNGLATSGNLESTGTQLQNQLSNYYLASNPSNYITSTNLNGLINTGSADLRYLQTGSSGQFYLASNPSNYITSTNLNGLLSTGSANLTYLVTGASGNFYLKSNPNQFASSGNVQSTGTALIARIAGLSGQLNITGGNLFSLINTERNKATVTGIQVTGSAAITGFVNIVGIYGTNIILSGANIVGISGGGGATQDLSIYYLKSNPNNFSSSGNVQSTGTSLQNQINNLIIPSVAGLISTGDVNIISGSLQDHIEFSGGYLYGLINASSAGVSSINGASGAMTIQGAGNVSVTTAAQTITVSGNTGFLSNYYPVSNPNNFLRSGDETGGSVSGLSTSGNVEATGTSLQNQINGLNIPSVVGLATSGNLESTGTSLQNQLSNYYLASNPSNYITSTNLNGLANTGYVNQVSGSINERINNLPTYNLNGLISTGDSDLRYLQTGVSGEFYKTSNPAGYITNINLNGLANTGYVNQVSGSINEKINNLPTYNLNGLTTSGELESTGTSLQNQINALPVYNLNGLINTGDADLRYLQTGVSGEFYKASNPAGYITSTNLNGLANTGYVNQVSGSINERINNIPTYNLDGLISTGSADARYLASGASGNFYSTSNPAGYITNTNLNGLISTGNVNVISGSLGERITNTGTTLQSQINSLDIPSVFGLVTSGNLEATGTSLQNQINSIGSPEASTVTINKNINFNYFLDYPYTGLNILESYIDEAFIATGINIGAITSGTGHLNFVFQQRVTSETSSQEVEFSNLNFSGTHTQYVLNNIPLTGLNRVSIDLKGIFTGYQGITINLKGINEGAAASGYYLNSNPSQFSTSGNLENTGTALQNQIDVLVIPSVVGLATSGNLESTGTSLQNQINGLNIPSVVGLATSGDLESTGTQLQDQLSNYYLASNPSNYITNSNLNGLISTGSANLTYLSTGVSGEFYKTSNPAGYITTSNLVGFANSGQVQSTGTSLQNQIDALPIYNLNGLTTSGELESTGTQIVNSLSNYYPISNPNNFTQSGQFISGVSITGGISIRNALNINAGTNITLSQQGDNTLLISSTAAGGSSYAGVTGVSVTGGIAISGNILMTGGGGSNVLLSGNRIIISSSSAGGAGEANTASNVGGGIGLFSGKESVDLRFYSITGGTGISVQLSGQQAAINISESSLTTLTGAGSVEVSTSGSYLFVSGVAEASRSITIESPTSTENWTVFRTDKNILITKVITVITGTSTPSVTWNIRHSSTRNSLGTSLLNNPIPTNNQTTGQLVTSFANPNISGGSFIRFTTVAQSGTVNEIHSTIYYK